MNVTLKMVVRSVNAQGQMATVQLTSASPDTTPTPHMAPTAHGNLPSIGLQVPLDTGMQFMGNLNKELTITFSDQ